MKWLRIGHTPDADDAFMFFGLTTGAVKIPDCEIEFILEDIQSLNLRTEKEDLDVTAVSAAAFPSMADHYWILSTGASVGRNYGPIIVSASRVTRLGAPQTPAGAELRGRMGVRSGRTRDAERFMDLEGRRVAIPGDRTTAAFLLNLYATNFQPVHLSFDQVIPAVKEGRADMGLVIHEGQITYANHGLAKVMDLGKLWMREFNLPIPLGLDVVKKELGRPLALQINRALRESIRWAWVHRKEALEFAARFGRGVQTSVLDQFVDMYVNNDTLNLGEEGKRALQTLFNKAKALSLIPAIPNVEIIEG